MNPRLFLSLLVFVVSSCGFHLRGHQPAGQGIEPTVSRIAITQSRASAVSNEVQSQLESAGATILPTPEGAEYTLSLSDQSIERTVLSISPASGKVAEYNLTLTVTMSILDGESNEIVSDQDIRLVRDFAFDEEALLGSVSEQRVVETEMIRQAATQIIRRLNAATRD